MVLSGTTSLIISSLVRELLLPGSTSSPQEPGPSNSSVPPGPQGLRKHFLRGRLDCDNQPPDPDRLFQRCFLATVTSVKVEGPA